MLPSTMVRWTSELQCEAQTGCQGVWWSFSSSLPTLQVHWDGENGGILLAHSWP